MSGHKEDESIPTIDLLSIEFDPNPSEFDEPIEISFRYMLSAELQNAFWECEVFFSCLFSLIEGHSSPCYVFLFKLTIYIMYVYVYIYIYIYI